MCLVALLIAIIWRDPLLVSNSIWHWKTVFALVFSPLFLLAVELGLLWLLARRTRQAARPAGLQDRPRSVCGLDALTSCNLPKPPLSRVRPF